MKITLNHKDLTIEVFDDPIQNAENSTLYDKIHRVDKEKHVRPISQHAIIVYRNNVKLSSTLLLGTAGGTSVTSDAVLIHGDNLVTRCSNMVFSLSLPGLQLNWMVEADWATCFSIHQYQDSYITHGETSITRIDRNGKLLWDYSGSDIFVCLEKGKPFDMHDNYIELTDFAGARYRINYNGETISYTA